MKSILQPKESRTCFLCSREGLVEEHHIFYGTANRKLSERYGLKVKLCPECHRAAKIGIHGGNRSADLKLKRTGQMAFEERYKDLCFREIFGINYL